LYLPYKQNFRSLMTLHVYTAGEPGSLIHAVQREMKTLAGDMPVSDVRTMKEIFERKGLLLSRLLAQMVAAMGLIGLTLAVVGLYAVLAFAVGRRTKEIGIRMALGASGESVRRMILGSGLRVTIVGTMIGLMGT